MLISFLRDNLRGYGFSIFKALADTDTLIAKVAVQEVRNGSDVVVHAGNINILCLSMHHRKDVLGEVFYETFKNTNDKLGGSKMSMRMSMSVFWITSYFYMHGMGATQHLETMEWVKFKAETVVRESLDASKPSSF